MRFLVDLNADDSKLLILRKLIKVILQAVFAKNFAYKITT